MIMWFAYYIFHTHIVVKLYTTTLCMFSVYIMDCMAIWYAVCRYFSFSGPQKPFVRTKIHFHCWQKRDKSREYSVEKTPSVEQCTKKNQNDLCKCADALCWCTCSMGEKRFVFSLSLCVYFFFSSYYFFIFHLFCVERAINVHKSQEKDRKKGISYMHTWKKCNSCK